MLFALLMRAVIDEVSSCFSGPSAEDKANVSDKSNMKTNKPRNMYLQLHIFSNAASCIRIA